MSVTITGRLVTQSGSPSGLEYVIIRNESVRVSIDGEVITGESVRVPVGEDGTISFEAEPGPAVIVVGRETSQYSRYELVPLWIPEEDSSLAEAFNLGQVNDLDATSPSVLKLISDMVDESIAGYEERVLDRVEDLIADIPGGGDIDLDGYATEEWVNGQLEIISLTPGPKGDRGPKGKDGDDASPLIVEGTTLDSDGNTIVTFSDGSTITVAKGQDGQNAEPLTVENTTLDDAGNTIISFSDGNAITVAKGEDGEDGKPGANASPLIVENTTLDDAGNTIVAFSDGNTITVAKGEDGQDGKPGDPGKPGDNAEPLTVETTSLDIDGNTIISFSDGSEVTVFKGNDGEDGQDGISPHIDEVTGHWFLGDTDTEIKAQGPQGDPGPPGTTEWGGITDRPATFPPDIRVVATAEEALTGLPGVWYAVEES